MSKDYFPGLPARRRAPDKLGSDLREKMQQELSYFTLSCVAPFLTEHAPLQNLRLKIAAILWDFGLSLEKVFVYRRKIVVLDCAVRGLC